MSEQHTCLDCGETSRGCKCDWEICFNCEKEINPKNKNAIFWNEDWYCNDQCLNEFIEDVKKSRVFEK